MCVEGPKPSDLSVVSRSRIILGTSYHRVFPPSTSPETTINLQQSPYHPFVAVRPSVCLFDPHALDCILLFCIPRLHLFVCLSVISSHCLSASVCRCCTPRKGFGSTVGYTNLLLSNYSRNELLLVVPIF